MPTLGNRIVVLEDCHHDAELLRYELSQRNIGDEIEVARTRKEFEAALDRGQPDLIIADYFIPNFSGISALAIAKQVCPSVPHHRVRRNRTNHAGRSPFCGRGGLCIQASV